MYKTIIGSICLFSSFFFVWGEFGLLRHYEEKQLLVEKQHSLLALKKEIGVVDQELYDWKTDTFYLEKMAREELGMGHKDEVVYVMH